MTQWSNCNRLVRSKSLVLIHNLQQKHLQSEFQRRCGSCKEHLHTFITIEDRIDLIKCPIYLIALTYTTHESYLHILNNEYCLLSAGIGGRNFRFDKNHDGPPTYDILTYSKSRLPTMDENLLGGWGKVGTFVDNGM